MKKRTKLVLAAVAVTAGMVIATSIYGREKNNVRAEEVPDSLMQQKLHHAQELLAALAIADYDGMTEHSRELQRISLEARWSQPPSNNYAAFGDDFRNALDRLIASSEKQNIDGAALNYVQVVLTCIECHKVVREGESIARDGDVDVLGLLNFSARTTPIASGEN